MADSNNDRSLILAIVLAVALTWSCGLWATPGATVKRFTFALEKGNIDTAIECLSVRFVSAVGIEKLRKILSEQTLLMRKKGGISSFVIDKEDVIGDIAAITATTKYGNGTSDTESVKLAKENGKWKIQSPK